MKNRKYKIAIMIVLIITAGLFTARAVTEYENYKISNKLVKTADLLFDQLKYAEAVEALNKAIDIYPYNYTAYEELASYYILIKKYDNAVDVYKNALIYMPKNEKLQLDLAGVYFMKKDYCNSLKYTESSMSLNNDSCPHIRYKLMRKLHDDMVNHSCSK